MLPDLLSRRSRHLSAGLLTVWLAVVSPLSVAQESEQPETKDVAVLIAKAYELTQNATTIDSYSSVISACEEAISAGPTDAQTTYLNRLSSWALNRRGEQYSNQASELASAGKSDEAAELDNKALGDFELSVDKDPTRWRAIHNRGISYAMTGRLQEAMNDFNRVIQLNESFEKAWFNRAETLYSLGQFERAISDYTRFLGLSSRDAAAYVSRGHAYFQLRRFREALSDYNRAVDLDSENAESWANRGDAYQSLGQWSQATEDYRRALGLDGNLARAYQSAAWLMSTCPDARFRDSDRALRAAQRAVELAGEDDFRYLDTWATAHANAGDFENAKKTLAKAIDIAPEEEIETLQRRMALFEQSQAYRQGMFQ